MMESWDNSPEAYGPRYDNLVPDLSKYLYSRVLSKRLVESDEFLIALQRVYEHFPQIEQEFERLSPTLDMYYSHIERITNPAYFDIAFLAIARHAVPYVLEEYIFCLRICDKIIRSAWSEIDRALENFVVALQSCEGIKEDFVRAFKDYVNARRINENIRNLFIAENIRDLEEGLRDLAFPLTGELVTFSLREEQEKAGGKIERLFQNAERRLLKEVSREYSGLSR